MYCFELKGVVHYLYLKVLDIVKNKIFQKKLKNWIISFDYNHSRMKQRTTQKV